MAQDVRTVFDLARLRASVQFPYLAVAVWRLVGPVLEPGLMRRAGGAIAVDRHWRVYIDPEMSWSIPALATVLRHEAWHCLRDHAGRRGARCVRRWGHATDLEINSDMSQEEPKPVWPYEGLLPQRLGLPLGLTAEQYYARLPEGEGDGTGGGGGRPDGSGEASACNGCGMCRGSDGPGGSNADGAWRPWERSAGGLEGVLRAEADAIRDAVAAEAQRLGRGNAPGWLLRWADSRGRAPKVNWRQALRGVLRASLGRRRGMWDVDRTRVSRRQATSRSPVLMPAHSRPQLRVACIIDTSGSMSQEQLDAALAEVDGVIKQSGAEEVVTLSCDVQVYGLRRVHTARSIQLEGGGGTDMRVGLAACEALRPRPDVVVVLTDTDSPWPAAPPPFSVVVCAIGAYGDAKSSCPPWARVVEVP